MKSTIIYAETESIYEIANCIFAIADQTQSIVEVDIGKIRNFAKHSFNQIVLKPDSKDLGVHIVMINLRSSSNYKLVGKPYRFSIEVIRAPKISFNCHLGPTASYCLPYISSVTNSAQVAIKFPLGITPYNSSFYSNIANALRVDLMIS